jgi:hypothetical protein
LPQEIGQRELRVQSVAGVAQVRDDDRFQPEAFIQLADQNQAGVRGDTRSLKRNLQKPVKRELERLWILSHPQGVILSGGVPYRNPQESRRGD